MKLAKMTLLSLLLGFLSSSHDSLRRGPGSRPKGPRL